MTALAGPPGAAHVKGPAEEPRQLTVGELLRGAAVERPDAPALIEGHADASRRRRWTYAQLLADAEACARALLARYQPGDRVALWSQNLPEYQVVQYGVALAGMTLVTVNPAFRAHEAEYVLAQSGAVACFAAGEFRGRPLLATARELCRSAGALREVVAIEQLEEFVDTGDAATALPEVDPRMAAQILYTSGTTGAPKGAMLPHVGMTNNIPHAARRIASGVQESPVWLAVLPMFHLAGCVVAALGSIALRGALLTVDHFDAPFALRLMEEERVTTMNLVPTMMIAMLQDPTFPQRDLARVGSIMLGGAPIAPELVRRVEAALGVPVIVGYGMTEAACVTMTSHLDSAEDRATTCGLPFPGVEVRIVDPRTQALCRTGEAGEAQTRGYHTMSGYHGDPQATSRALTEDGWYRSGDLCTLDERGYLRVVGRTTEMIIRGGENVYPREIEDELLHHGAIAEAAVIGLPDDYYGEAVAAFVRLREGHAVAAEELRTSLRERLTGHKVPSRWFFVADYPRTPSGKIRKFVLREQWERGAYDADEAAT